MLKEGAGGPPHFPVEKEGKKMPEVGLALATSILVFQWLTIPRPRGPRPPDSTGCGPPRLYQGKLLLAI